MPRRRRAAREGRRRRRGDPRRQGRPVPHGRPVGPRTGLPRRSGGRDYRRGRCLQRRLCGSAGPRARPGRSRPLRLRRRRHLRYPSRHRAVDADAGRGRSAAAQGDVGWAKARQRRAHAFERHGEDAWARRWRAFAQPTGAPYGAATTRQQFPGRTRPGWRRPSRIPSAWYVSVSGGRVGSQVAWMRPAGSPALTVRPWGWNGSKMPSIVA